RGRDREGRGPRGRARAPGGTAARALPVVPLHARRLPAPRGKARRGRVRVPPGARARGERNRARVPRAPARGALVVRSRPYTPLGMALVITDFLAFEVGDRPRYANRLRSAL